MATRTHSTTAAPQTRPKRRAWTGCGRRPPQGRLSSPAAPSEPPAAHSAPSRVPSAGREEESVVAARGHTPERGRDEQGGVRREWPACGVAPPGDGCSGDAYCTAQKAGQAAATRMRASVSVSVQTGAGRVRAVAAAAHPLTRRRSSRHRSPCGLRWRGSTPDARSSPRQPTSGRALRAVTEYA